MYQAEPAAPLEQSNELIIPSDELVSAQEVFFKTEDLLRSTWEQDFKALKVMQLISKKHKEMADKERVISIVRLLNEEKATFTDFGIKTKQDLATFAEKLGIEQCKKIIRLMLPTELICDKGKFWGDCFGSEVVTWFPNITHLSFKTKFTIIPNVDPIDKQERFDPLKINWSFLVRLPLLESLDLSGGYHNISTLEFLDLVPQLKIINLNGCKNIFLDSFEILKNLTNLIEIELDGCRLSDISFIKSMPNLKKLNLQNCLIYSGYEYLAASTQLISLKVSNLKSMEYLKNLKNLEELDLSRNKFIKQDLCKYIDDLKFLTGLKKLNMQSIVLSNLSFLSSLENLEHLNLSQCCGQTIFLPQLKKLISLDLSESPIKNIEVGGPFPQLRDLNLSRTNLSNIDFVELMENLERLNLSDILRMRGLKSCAKLTKLKILNLQRCGGIIDRNIFMYLTSLQDLNLSECSWVFTIDFLKKLSKLQSLNLKNCRGLISLDGLEFLTNLKFLSVSEPFFTSVFSYLRYDERD